MESEPSNISGIVAARRSLIPPHLVMRDFLSEETVIALLEFARTRQPSFAPTYVDVDLNAVKPAVRRSVGLRELGAFRDILKSRLIESLPAFVSGLGVTSIDSPKFDIELVAHGDGAFYKRHIDTQTARYCDLDQIRVLSAVYYFYAEPKAFEGGALRLFAIGAEPAPYIDIAPMRNSLLVFPSWAPHEVMPVSCPSNAFADSRFAINCWVLRDKVAAAPDRM